MASYSLSKDAEADVRRLYRHGIEHFGLAQADGYFDGLFERFDQIAARPQMYPAVDEIRQGYRRSVYGAHSIYYRVSNNQVEIMRVLGREDPSVA
jgi:toxin ParE1/3/4